MLLIVLENSYVSNLIFSNFGISISVDIFSSSVESRQIRTMTIGGSADVGVSIGGDLTVDIDTKDLDISISGAKSSGTGGNTRGLNEYIIPNAVQSGAVKVTNVSGVNPEF